MKNSPLALFRKYFAKVPYETVGKKTVAVDISKVVDLLNQFGGTGRRWTLDCDQIGNFVARPTQSGFEIEITPRYNHNALFRKVSGVYRVVTPDFGSIYAKTNCGVDSTVQIELWLKTEKERTTMDEAVFYNHFNFATLRTI